jgi:hypothetical protein
VESEEAGRGDERNREAEDAGVSTAGSGFAGEEGERSGEDPRDEDEPEMRRLILPVDVELRVCEQEREACDRRDEEDQTSDCSSRRYSSP